MATTVKVRTSTFPRICGKASTAVLPITVLEAGGHRSDATLNALLAQLRYGHHSTRSYET